MLHDGRSTRVGIVGGVRIPFCRSHSIYTECSNQDLMTATLKALVDKYDLRGQTLGDVALGAVLKHSRDWNLARECVIDSGLSLNTPGVDMQRACGTSIEAAIHVGNKIALGQIEAGIAGGTDTVSDPPIALRDGYRNVLMRSFRGKNVLQKISPWFGMRPGYLKPEFPSVFEPRTKLSMGESTEITAKEWEVSREHQDQLALSSHMKAAGAYDTGFYDDLVVPSRTARKTTTSVEDTSLEKLATLKPVFDKGGNGTMTAGNSTPLTDGAAAVLLATEDWASRKNLPILAYLTHCKVAAVDFIDREGLLMAPAYAVSEMLKAADLTLQDFDFYEIHEAFAAADDRHAESLAVRALLPRASRPQRTARSDRPGAPQRQGRQHRHGPPVCRNRRTHHCDHGQAAPRSRFRPGPGIGVHGGRHGRHRHHGSRLTVNRVVRARPDGPTCRRRSGSVNRAPCRAGLSPAP